MSVAIDHGTHQEALGWAFSRCNGGAVLEVGSGWWSTGLLRGWCSGQGRNLYTVETEPDFWATFTGLFQRVGETSPKSRHEFLPLGRGEIQLPREYVALGFVDGINEDRAAWIDELHGKSMVVVHDTEPGRDDMPGVAEALGRFANRRDFTRMIPHTTVVW